MNSSIFIFPSISKYPKSYDDFLISNKGTTLLNDIFLTLVLDPSLLAIPINKLFTSILSIDIAILSTLIPLSPVLLNTILLTPHLILKNQFHHFNYIKI